VEARAAVSRETGNRAEFLATVRRAVGTAGPRSHARPISPLPDGVVPPVAYAATAPDLVAQFTDALASLGGVARTLSDADAFTAFVDDAIAAARGADPTRRVRVVLTNEPECAAVAYALGARDDIDVVDYTDAAAVATADVGFTGARGAVALTGSIVVDAGRANGRTVSLLPPLHVALVATTAVVATPGDLWRTMADPMPSNLVQITGPSRSADIELIITLGVHGPRALWVGLVDSAARGE
jgi:L-lactate dehydrogenase complex protein LldG